MKFTKEYFMSDFLPSLEKRMNNPKYPDTCIISDKQFQVCRNFMTLTQEIRQKKNGDSYVQFIYQITIPEKGRIKRFKISRSREYIFLNRDYFLELAAFIFAYNDTGELFYIEADLVSTAIDYMSKMYNTEPREYSFVEQATISEAESLGIDRY